MTRKSDKAGKNSSGYESINTHFAKAKFTSKTLILNEYEICLRMQEMAILETQIFKNF